MEAQKLKSKIKEKGIKQVWIAEKIGVTRSLVSQWVKGSVIVPEKYNEQLKRLLD